MKAGLIFALLLALLADFALARGEYTVAVLHWIAAIPKGMRGWSAALWGSE